MKKCFTDVIKLILCSFIVFGLFGCSAYSKNEIDEPNNIKQSENQNTINVYEDNESEDGDAEYLFDTEIEDNTYLSDELTETQLNSLAWLNYLATLTEEILSKKNSRMFLEEAYASLINNTSPDKINELTESHLASLLDNIEKYRMIGVKRDRLQYIYEQSKAKALKESVPNPVGLLSAVSSLDIKKIAASAIYMAVDSYSSYKAYNAELDLQYMQDNWELDDEESANLHDSRKRAFLFMVETCRDEALKGKYTLSENAVKDFVECQNNPNVFEKLQFLENEEKTYQAFGLYWLELANCYYEEEKYDKCIAAIKTYESLQVGIFRKDYYLARAIPNVIVATREERDTEAYVSEAERYLNVLMENTERSDWSLRYFAAQIYIDLYSKTNDTRFLNEAYNIALNNVTELVSEQRKQNNAYLEDIKEVKLDNSKDSNNKKQTDEEKNKAKEEEKAIKKYNNALKEQRKIELPPVYEPLTINLDLLFALADKCNISLEEQKKIEGILRNNSPLFLSEQLENHYSFVKYEVDSSSSFNKNKLTLHANLLSANSKITVRIVDNNNKVEYNDWTVKEVQRSSKDIEDFTVTYTSKTVSKHQWSPNAIVYVDIIDETSPDLAISTIEFKANYTERWWLIPDSIEFEQIH